MPTERELLAMLRAASDSHPYSCAMCRGGRPQDHDGVCARADCIWRGYERGGSDAPTSSSGGSSFPAGGATAARAALAGSRAATPEDA
jgi:hypothetical protein